MTAHVCVAAGRDGGEEAARGGAAHRARDPDVAAAAEPAGRAPGLSLAAAVQPAREVGGDYYDFLPLEGNRLGLLIADVSGKGTSAALYMAELKGLMLSLSQIHRSPRDLLIAANRIIAAHLDSRSFITMTYAVLDLDARTMTCARAGHTPLIHLPGACTASARRRSSRPTAWCSGCASTTANAFERAAARKSRCRSRRATSSCSSPTASARR